MEQPLISKQKKFIISKETLSSMFTLTSMQTKENLKIYKDLGGAPVLLRRLKTSSEVILLIKYKENSMELIQQIQ